MAMASATVGTAVHAKIMTKPTKMNKMLLLIITAMMILSGVTIMAAEQQQPQQDNETTIAITTATTEEIVYRVGVLAIRGFPAAYAEFNSTYSDYLTASAGAALSTPQRRIRFELKPLNFGLLFTDVADRLVDFIYVNPSAYSCIESEYGANSLASQISLRKVSGNEYRLTQFGGVIFSKADRDDIRSVRDIENKTVAAANIAGLGSGQMQFRLLQQKGMSYINDPLRLVFTSNQGKVVAGVLSGEFDVGFVRTDQLERSKNKDGELIDLNSVKIIEPISNLRGDDGQLFPFDSSTTLYPEWNIAALTFVPPDVGGEVQRAMLDLSKHADIGKELEDCYLSCEPEAAEEEGGNDNEAGDGEGEGTIDETTGENTDKETIIIDVDACRNACSTKIIPKATCQATNNQNVISPEDIFATPNAETSDASAVPTVESTANFGQPFQTTPQLALLAHKARQKGKYAGWRSTLSYMELRNMQEETGFIQRQEADPSSSDGTVSPSASDDGGSSGGGGGMACVRASKIYDAVVCPPGHFRKSLKEVEEGCFSKEVGSIGCPEGMQCLCRPCKKAYDVDVFPIMNTSDGDDAVAVGEAGGGASVSLVANARLAGSGGCEKMSICGTQQQRQSLTFLVVDNRKRDNLEMTVVISQGDETRQIVAMPLRAISEGGNLTIGVDGAAEEYEDPNRYAYQFTVSSSNVGVVILEIFANNAQIGESPLRVEYTPRDCSGEFDDALLSADPEGNCVCVDNSVDVGGRCVALSTLLPAILVPIALIALISIRFYVERKKKQADSVWNVTSEELKFDDPPEIVGRGTFGLVLVAEYRGTKVAVKRVIPPKISKQYRNRSSQRRSSNGGSSFSRKVLGRQSSLAVEVDDAFVGRNERRRSSMMSSFTSAKSGGYGDMDSYEEEDDKDLESGLRSGDGLNSGNLRELSAEKRGNNSGGNSSGGYASGMASGIIPTVETAKRISTLSIVASPFQKDQYAKLKADFINEMRYLSKLRHPCVTTVMGAVISKKEEPMLVMEFMDHGSLYDLLHNTTMVIEGELLLPILQDIAKGVRFLHAADPRVIHGDLKAANVLVDSKFRAKVADFGLSQKKRVGATGTPYWMAPELIRRETENTTASDVYSFGIILYEVYSRKDPYEGEDYKEVMRLVADSKVNKRPPVPPACPPQVEILMSDCLVSAPHNRPSFEELDQRLRRLEVDNIEFQGQQTFSLQSSKSSKMQRTDDLLFQVFPQHVAEALRDGRKVEPEHRDMVTIFFSDIVSFTDISGQLSPLKVSDMLDRLYSRFDDISREHDVFKVETIGDAYMAVTNLVKDQPDHARRIAAFSVDAIAAANQTLIDLDDESLGHVNIRVGFHSGPVVANVVGSRNPRFCLFGDTVNTASRMESNSRKNRIHCSERAAKLVKKQYPEICIKKRGKIQIKGKGEMKTFWINEKGRKRRATDQSAESNCSFASQQSAGSSVSGTGSHVSDSSHGPEELAKKKSLDNKGAEVPQIIPVSMAKSKKSEAKHTPELSVLAEEDAEDGSERDNPSFPLTDLDVVLENMNGEAVTEVEGLQPREMARFYQPLGMRETSTKQITPTKHAEEKSTSEMDLRGQEMANGVTSLLDSNALVDCKRLETEKVDIGDAAAFDDFMSFLSSK